MKDPEKLADKVTENYLENKDLIDDDEDLLLQKWQAGDYFNSGMMLAYLGLAAIGPMPD